MGVVYDYSLTTKDPTEIKNYSAVLQGNSLRGSWECILWGFHFYKDGDDPPGSYLAASYAYVKWDFLQTQRRLRLKFSDSTFGQTFYIRFYGLNQKEGEVG